MEVKEEGEQALVQLQGYDNFEQVEEGMLWYSYKATTIVEESRPRRACSGTTMRLRQFLREGKGVRFSTAELSEGAKSTERWGQR